MKVIKGRIVLGNGEVLPFELYPERTPVTVDNFVKLVKQGFYNGKVFHRVVPFFVSQGGSVNGDGTGDLGYTIPNEAQKGRLMHKMGSLAMARGEDLDSACCQFYISHVPAPHLDSSYTVFGQVTKNLGAIRKMKNGDVMTLVEIVEE